MANFNTVGGTITLNDDSGPVAADHLDFSNGGNVPYVLNGAAPDTVLYTTSSSPNNNPTANPMIIVENGSSAVTINANIDHVGGDFEDITNNSSNDLTINGTIDYNNQTTLYVDANSSGKIIINGGVLDANTTGLYLLGGGTVEFGANSNMSSLDSGANHTNLSLIVGGGTAIFDGTDNFLSTSAMTLTNGTILLNGSFTGTQNVTAEHGSAHLGGNTAAASGWSGAIYLDNLPPTITLSQVAGGRFTYASTASGPGGVGINGNNQTYLITSGDGTVVLGTGNSYQIFAPNFTVGGNTYTLAADLQAKTTLITNTSGSAFGNNIGVVQVEAGKTLGGSGISTQTIVAMDHTSKIAAGDSGVDGGVASIGTLHLTGGITATSGLTMDFKLTSPGVNDALDLGAGNFALSGNVTVNLSAFGDFQTGTYTLASGTGGVWSDDGATFAFTTPAGDSVTSYDFNTTTDQFTVTVATPEPSTYALMGLGILALVWFARRKNALV